MVKSDKKKKAPRLPSQIDRAIAAAEDKKAVDLVVLDLRKAAGFTDFFVIASGTNARQDESGDRLTCGQPLPDRSG